MLKKEKDIIRNTYVLATLAVLIAVQIVMTRYIVIDLGFARFSLGSVATIMAGLWFGPVGGGLTGGIADIIGSFMKGYSPNPLILISNILWGVIPAILVHYFFSGSRTMKMIKLSAYIVLTSLVCTMGFTFAGLVLYYGYNFWSTLPVRAIQFAVMSPVFCVLSCCLYFSPITAYLRETLRGAVWSSASGKA